MREHASSIFGEMSALAVETGAVNLGQGFPDTDGPQSVKDAAIRLEGPGGEAAPDSTAVLFVGEAFLQVAAEIPIRPTVQPYPFEEADRALADLAADRVDGAAVLVVDPTGGV